MKKPLVHQVASVLLGCVSVAWAGSEHALVGLEETRNSMFVSKAEVAAAQAMFDQNAGLISTRLTVLDSDVAEPQRPLVRLELFNASTNIFWYCEHPSVLCDAFHVWSSKGDRVMYVGPSRSTVVTFRQINPGQSVTLIDRFDLIDQYPSLEEGRLYVQFTGKGLQLAVGSSETTQRVSQIGVTNQLPSNVVQIEIPPKPALQM